MDVIRNIYKEKGNLHHAYLLVGNRDLSKVQLVQFLEKDLHFSPQGNPDFLEIECDACGIDEARSLKLKTGMKALGDRKVVILSFSSITTEAQNSLLKIFEDGVNDTVFFVIAPTLEIFLPTLLSRFFITKMDDKNLAGSKSAKNGKDAAGQGQNSQYKNFLSLLPAKRLELVTDIIEEKNKTEALQFFNYLEEALHEELLKKNMDAEIAKACDEVLKFKGFLYDRSPSVKMILEHISCTMPILQK